MIKEYEYLHGVVFCRLCRVPEVNISISPYNCNGNSSYVLNNKAGLYIKYSGKRLTPWTFTFTEAHQDEVLEMNRRFGEVFVAFVCNLDGVAVLNFKELKNILDDIHDEHEWVGISRTRNKMYSLKASDGKLDFKVSMTSC